MDGYTQKNTRSKILYHFILGSGLLFPFSLSNYSTTSPAGIVLKFSKASPPLAILEDEKIFPQMDEEPHSIGYPVPLVSSRIQARKMAIKIARSFEGAQKESEIFVVKNNNQQKDIRFLGGLSLNKASPNILQIKKSLGISAEAVRIHIVKEKTPKPAEESTKDFLSTLSPALRDRAEEIENINEVINEDYSGESFEEIAARTVLEEKQTVTEKTQEDTHAERQESEKIITAVQAIRKQQPGTKISNNFANNRLIKRSAPKPEEILTPEISEKGMPVASRGMEPPRQALISGNLELSRGLALSPNQKISIFREIAGSKVSQGQAIINEGRYEIFVEDPESGIIVAELEDNQQLIGRGEILIPEVIRNAANKEDLKKIHMKINPLVEQISTQTVSAYSYLKNDKLSAITEKINNLLNKNTSVLASSIVASAEKEDHWGNLVFGSSKQAFKHTLYPDATIEAMAQILGTSANKSSDAIIKGVVKIDGKPVAGAVVEILNQQDKKPSYYNAFIPDKNLTQTTANGEFVFLGLQEGSYILKAKHNGKSLSPQLAVVGTGYISQVNFDVQKPSLSEAYVFDIKNSEMLNAKIRFLGSEKETYASGRKIISFSGNEGIQFLEVESQDPNYLMTRLTVDKSEKQILVPMIPQEWMSELMTRLRVNILPEHAQIIGTAKEAPYSVELDPAAYNEDTKIIYFDNQGHLATGAVLAPQGGGFVALNVNPGVRSLFVRYNGIKSIKITTMAADATAVNIFNSKF